MESDLTYARYVRLDSEERRAYLKQKLGLPLRPSMLERWRGWEDEEFNKAARKAYDQWQPRNSEGRLAWVYQRMGQWARHKGVWHRKFRALGDVEAGKMQSLAKDLGIPNVSCEPIPNAFTSASLWERWYKGRCGHCDVARVFGGYVSDDSDREDFSEWDTTEKHRQPCAVKQCQHYWIHVSNVIFQ